MDAGGLRSSFSVQTQPEPTTASDVSDDVVNAPAPMPASELQSATESGSTSEVATVAAADTEAANAMPQAIVANWSRIAESGISEPLFRRLVRLASRSDGWRGPGSRSVTAEALRTFLDFWSKVQHQAVEPAIVLTADGGLQAEWFLSKRQHLDLHFRSDAKVFYGLFSGGSVHEGVERPNHLVVLLTAYPERPLTWKS